MQAAISAKVANSLPAIVQLNSENTRLVIAPHLTLYQVTVPIHNLQLANDALSMIASRSTVLFLNCGKYNYNPEEGSLEVQYAKTDGLLDLQTDVIAVMNLLREGNLINRDPAGNDVAKRCLEEKDEVFGNSLRRFGFPECGSLFNPHSTLSWIRKDETTIENVNSIVSTLPEPSHLSGNFTKLGIYCLGPQVINSPFFSILSSSIAIFLNIQTNSPSLSPILSHPLLEYRELALNVCQNSTFKLPLQRILALLLLEGRMGEKMKGWIVRWLS